MELEEEKSKSQKKRDAEAQQKLGVELIQWSQDKLNLLPLPETLRQAITEAKSLKSHGAIRRQAQLIGKLMRTAAGIDDIHAAYEAIIAEEKSQTAKFHNVEVWRTRLMNDGRDALTDFVDAYHPEDLQQLKQLIKKALDEQKKGLHTASRALFRFIRSCIK